jgi:hypothetical protein
MRNLTGNPVRGTLFGWMSPAFIAVLNPWLLAQSFREII